jgi:hypothetical protein
MLIAWHEITNVKYAKEIITYKVLYKKCENLVDITDKWNIRPVTLPPPPPNLAPMLSMDRAVTPPSLLCLRFYITGWHLHWTYSARMEPVFTLTYLVRNIVRQNEAYSWNSLPLFIYSHVRLNIYFNLFLSRFCNACRHFFWNVYCKIRGFFLLNALSVDDLKCRSARK